MSTKSLYEWPSIGGSVLEKRLDVRKTQRAELQKVLPSPVYWWQFPTGRKIFWNWRLVRDYLLNGPGPSHDKLVEEYLRSLDNAA